MRLPAFKRLNLVFLFTVIIDVLCETTFDQLLKDVNQTVGQRLHRNKVYDSNLLRWNLLLSLESTLIKRLCPCLQSFDRLWYVLDFGLRNIYC